MKFDLTLGDASAVFEKGLLKVSNPHVERCWQWTGKGFVTNRLASTGSGTVWTRGNSSLESDWLIPGYDDPQEGELTSIEARVSDDEGFTSEHIEVLAGIDYPTICLSLLFRIWIYPDAPGIRTQVSIRAHDGYDPEAGDSALKSHHRVDFIPVEFGALQRRMFGYYNETQQRNDACEDILKEEVFSRPLKNREFHTWPSVLCLENEQEGLALVKESHKCPNQPGSDCGLFVCDADLGLTNLGWGLAPNEIDSTWREAWASWCIVYKNTEIGRENAFKAFDAARYPFDAARDVYVQANTWGSSISGEVSRLAAVESAVLEELDSCADLGIDILQIDDGWQTAPGAASWKPDENGWHPHPASYPNGWVPIKARAQELNVKLGLWAAAMPVELQELKDNFDDGGFVTYKLDFAELRKHEDRRALMQKVRDFIKYTEHTVRVNWDVTEVSKRYGYFYAREFGCLYLANRKPIFPPTTTYRPHTMLRDLWELSRYINLRKIQGSVQNIDKVNKQLSDAYLYPHDYCVAITLMSTPLFFQETKFYTEEARKQIRPLLQVYKKHRDAIFSGTVYPIGDKPDNYSWSGFQNHDADSGTGYLMLFRELNNDEASAPIKLNFVSGRKLAITDLMTQDQRIVEVGADGIVDFACDAAPSYLFLRYA